MYNKSRISLFDYLYNLFYDVVTKNVYSMRVPSENTTSDTTDGFIVIFVDPMQDLSEMDCEAYGQVRCYVQAFVPPLKRGRLDRVKYKAFEDKILEVIDNAIADSGSDTYQILSDGILSMDTDETTNANNAYFTFIKSFIVTIN